MVSTQSGYLSQCADSMPRFERLPLQEPEPVVIGLLFLGVFVDRRAGTSPFGVLCFTVIAVTFGTIAVYSIVSKSFPQPPTGGGDRSGEDS